MAFLPVFNLAKIRKVTDEPKFATVVYNNDPLYLGRIKVELEGLFEGTEDSLPWIRRKMDTAFCGLNTEMFDVPEVGSVVEIRWNYDEHTAFYSGAPYNQKHQTSSFTGNYPYEGGWKFGDILIKLDKGSNSLLIENGEVQILMDGLGGLSIAAASGIDIRCDNDLVISAPNVIIDGNCQITESLTTGNGASGIISACSIASVSGGIIESVE